MRFRMGIMSVVIILSTMSCLVQGSSPEKETLLWPLDLPERYLTSNFMEYRTGRFHAGLDLKTQSRTGFPVYAVEDGWIEKIRISTGGYGKALYLRGKSGTIYVYAHLQLLNDGLAEHVRNAQTRRESYTVTLSLGTKHPVRQGEILALSGQSGAAGPHLHFEVRNAGNQPVDPQLHGFPVPDGLPPRIQRIRVHPAAINSRIEGDVVARSWSSGEALSGTLPAVHIEGPVVFSLEVLDHADIRHHVLEPASIRLSLDDSLVFSARNRSYDFNQSTLMCLEWLVQPGRRERWLYRRSGNDLPDREGAAWSLDPYVMTPGPHQLDLSVADAAGNRTTVTWQVIVGGTQPLGHTVTWTADPARVEVPAGETAPAGWLSPFLASQSLMSGQSDAEVEALPEFRTQIRSQAMTPQQNRDVLRIQGLEFGGYMTEVYCADWTVTGSLKLDLGSPPLVSEVDLKSWNVYRLKSNGDWGSVADLRRQGDTLVCDVNRPGTYALFRDRDRPYLGPGPEEGLVARSTAPDYPGLTVPCWETVVIGLEDQGSGIDVASLRVQLDDSLLIAEPDLPRHRLLLDLPATLAAGGHDVSVEVADRAGNIASRRYVLQLEQ